ncbi:molybdenum cofactor synthesis 2, partial [Pterulicium gracile]
MSVEAAYTSEDGTLTCSLTYEPLDVARVTEWVGADEAGALGLFIGTTRNSFQGKKVRRLEYEAYSKLAMRTMIEVLEDARTMTDDLMHRTPSHAPASFSQLRPSKTPSSLIKLALHHRLGSVPVGQPSIVIAVSSPHRKEAFVACEWILEETKKRVQVWKKEVYDTRRRHD